MVRIGLVRKRVRLTLHAIARGTCPGPEQGGKSCRRGSKASRSLVCRPHSWRPHSSVSNVVSANEQPTGTWQEAGALSEVRSDATATELADGRVLVAGGANHDSVLASAEILTADGDVRVVTNMSTPRAGHTARRPPDGRVLVTGGLTQGGAGTATAEIFDRQRRHGRPSRWPSHACITPRRS